VEKLTKLCASNGFSENAILAIKSAQQELYQVSESDKYEKGHLSSRTHSKTRLAPLEEEKKNEIAKEISCEDKN
jgi:hypothetical protein